MASNPAECYTRERQVRGVPFFFLFFFDACRPSVRPSGRTANDSLHTVDLNRVYRRSALSSPHFPPATTRLRCETNPSHSHPTSTSTRSWARFGQNIGQAALLSACDHGWLSAPDPMARRRRAKTTCAVSDRLCNAWPSRYALPPPCLVVLPNGVDEWRLRSAICASLCVQARVDTLVRCRVKLRPR